MLYWERLPGSAYAMSKQKSLADRLADLTSAAPSEAFNPDEPDFDDGTGAGIYRWTDICIGN